LGGQLGGQGHVSPRSPSPSNAFWLQGTTSDLDFGTLRDALAGPPSGPPHVFSPSALAFSPAATVFSQVPIPAFSPAAATPSSLYGYLVDSFTGNIVRTSTTRPQTQDAMMQQQQQQLQALCSASSPAAGGAEATMAATLQLLGSEGAWGSTGSCNAFGLDRGGGGGGGLLQHQHDADRLAMAEAMLHERIRAGVL
jgi:hypothetical protein